jgi:sigma-B regulation protein RsbU (phosphoserine phosphatase)
MSAIDERPHVLIADDQVDVLESLRLLLGPEGFRTEAVTTPDQVVTRVGAGSVDLLLMDLNYTRDTTSGTEGLSLIERIHALAPLVPIVAMTGWSTVELAVEAMRKGVRHFVQKPWDNESLVALVRAEVDEGRVRRRHDVQQRRELEEARLMQRSLLPRTLPVLPGLALAVHWEPAQGVAGDAFDIALVDEHRLAISVADVEGKGMPAALLMSNIQASARAYAGAASPAAVCARINEGLVGQVPDGRFVTFFLGHLDPSTRRFAYTNAGHNPPVLRRRDGRVVRLDCGGPVLGVLPGALFEPGAVMLEPGDRLVLFTDGVVEASNGTEEFGDERLLAIVDRSGADSPGEIVARVVDAVRGFATQPGADDRTVVVLAVD